MHNKSEQVGYFFGEPVYSSKKRNDNINKDSGRDFAINKVKKSGLLFESKFNDSLFIISGIKGKVEFYPGTGVFVCKATGYRGKGAENLIRYAKSGSISF